MHAITIRIPDDLLDDIDRLATDTNRVTTIRRLLRHATDLELAGTPPPTSLFGAAAITGASHTGDPSTSRRAALDNQPRAGSQRARLLAYIANAMLGTGLTYDEANMLDEKAGIHVAGVGLARRASELLDAEAIEPLLGSRGEPVTRRTRHGSEATVYVLTGKGRRWHWQLAAASIVA